MTRNAADQQFIDLFPLIQAGASDPAQFCQEGGQLGAAQHRQAQHGAQPGPPLNKPINY